MAQIWAVQTLGGYTFAPNLSKYIRRELQTRCKFRRIMTPHDNIGKHKGADFYWNVYGNLPRGRRLLAENQPIPAGSVLLSQNTAKLSEYGYSTEYTGLLDDLSEQDIKDILHNVLLDDARMAYDAEAHQASVAATPLRVVPAGGSSATAVTLSTNGVPATTNNVEFRKAHQKQITNIMKERNIPPFIGDDYIAISRPSAFSTLSDDLEAVSQYTETGYGKIISGERGRYDGVRYVEQTNIPSGGAADSTTWNPYTGVADPWNNGKSDRISFCGKDVGVVGVAVPVELRAGIPQDMGRDKRIGYYSIEGYAPAYSPTTQQDHWRALLWDSAA
jgi:hypothetical protein